MKKFARFIFLSMLSMLAVEAQAITYTFTPNPADLGDLDHYRYVRWGIAGSQADALKNSLATPNTIISSATLKIKQIDNWDNKTNWLFINLLDDPGIGVNSWVDNSNDNVFADKFDGNPNFISSDLLDWSDTNGTGNPQDLVYGFTAAQLNTLTSYITDPTTLNRAIFGLGFDPDCHYFNNGASLVITTETCNVPDGGTTAALTGAAVLALGVFRRAING